MPEPEPPHVHVPQDMIQDVVDLLKRGDQLWVAIGQLEGIITSHTQREPGPGMTEVRAQALYEATSSYFVNITATGRMRIKHVLKVIREGGTL